MFPREWRGVKDDNWMHTRERHHTELMFITTWRSKTEEQQTTQNKYK